MDREGEAVTCNGRLFYRRAAPTGKYIEHPEMLIRQNVVIVWLECLLVDVVCHIGMLAPDRFEIYMPKQRPYN